MKYLTILLILVLFWFLINYTKFWKNYRVDFSSERSDHSDKVFPRTVWSKLTDYISDKRWLPKPKLRQNLDFRETVINMCFQ